MILENVSPKSRMLSEELFGPALPLVPISDIDKGIRLANDSPYVLDSSIWTRNMAYAWRAIHEIDAGYTWVNDMQIAYDELPFGGTKQSGCGKEHHNEAFLQCTELKSVVFNSEG